jgi:hypothetical protein
MPPVTPSSKSRMTSASSRTPEPTGGPLGDLIVFNPNPYDVFDNFGNHIGKTDAAVSLNGQLIGAAVEDETGKWVYTQRLSDGKIIAHVVLKNGYTYEAQIQTDEGAQVGWVMGFMQDQGLPVRYCLGTVNEDPNTCVPQ